jgi:hypothetical protein
MAGLAKQEYEWKFVAAVPPREVFATFEQLIGTFPYQFEPVGHDEARVVETERKGVFGGWTKAKRKLKWVACRGVYDYDAPGTQVVIQASKGKAAMMRALQVVQLLTRGVDDRRTIYRSREIAPGPVSLVASWAGTPYKLFTEPRFDAPRGAEILTATRVEAIAGGRGAFTKVRLPAGAEGFVERDQIVSGPQEATREAQESIAERG